MDFPEGSNVKAPWGFRFSLWSLPFLPFWNCPLSLLPGHKKRNVKNEGGQDGEELGLEEMGVKGNPPEGVSLRDQGSPRSRFF